VNKPSKLTNQGNRSPNLHLSHFQIIDIIIPRQEIKKNFFQDQEIPVKVQVEIPLITLDEE